ncbi:MAG: type II toxin-antitoxin system HicB family antitoxin [Bacteroidales bacterium]|nr:type II toxin-antitoxin system HicB family antitoxin [Bacteroidales bacterium]
MMNTLTYKDYIGSVSFSAEDEVFYGKIEHVNDLITFESEYAHDLKKAFEEAVDDYIIFCKEKNIQPDKPFKGSFNVRVKPSIHKLAYQRAIQQGMSLNKFIEKTLEKELKE